MGGGCGGSGSLRSCEVGGEGKEGRAGGEVGGGWQLDRGELGLVTSKPSYQVGEEAAILVTTPYTDVSQILVVVQGFNELLAGGHSRPADGQV